MNLRPPARRETNLTFPHPNSSRLITTRPWLSILVVTLFLSLSACQGESVPVPATEAPPASTGTPAPSSTEVDPAVLKELPITERSFKMGTAGFIPRNYPDTRNEDWQDFLAQGAASYGGMFGIHLKPGADANDAGIPNQIQLAFEHMHGVEPYVAFAINHEGGPFTKARGEKLKRVAVATAETYQPRIISLGVEINSLYLTQGDSFPLYVDYARDIYDAVKEVSPNTRVMNNFQLERMKGDTALTGQNFEPHWHLIERFEGKLDLVSFTVYPYLHYHTPGEIPLGYLAEIREHTDLPVMITETGWPTQDIDNGAKGSNQHQIEYMMKLFQGADELDMDAIIWVFPHDAPFGIAGDIFDYISLRKNDGTPKPALLYWQAALSLPLHSDP